MTRHALAAHAPDGAIFAVSSFGPGAEGNRPPSELHPMGLEGPLCWLAEQLEARDRAAMTAVWERAAHDLSRLERVVVGLRAAVSALEPVVPVPRPAPGDGSPTPARAAAAAGRCLLLAGCAWPVTTPWDSAARWRSSARATAPRRRSRGDGPTCWNGTRRWASSGRRWSARPGARRPSGWSRRPGSRSPTARPPPTYPPGSAA